jgi:polyphosphate kinase
VLKNILQIQLNDNVKARILDNELQNQYVREKGQKRIRSQVEIYQYLYQQGQDKPEQLPMLFPEYPAIAL